MAELHEATITPRKDELVEPWLPTRPWWDGVEERGPVGSFRLDDPAGEVGIECFLFGSEAGSILIVPLTYRGAPLPGADQHLLGTMEHSVLGSRWVYDGCGDPVFVATLIETIRAGGSQAEEHIRRADGTVVTREPRVTVRGDGAPEVTTPDPSSALTVVEEPTRSVVTIGGLEVALARQGTAALPDGPGLRADFGEYTGLLIATVSAP